MTISTITSGTLALVSAGALNFTSTSAGIYSTGGGTVIDLAVAGGITFTGTESTVGGIRLPNAVLLGWRNAGDSANATLGLNSSDQIEIAGAGLLSAIIPRVGTVADSATPTPAGDSQDLFTVTALAQAATIGTPGGTPLNGQKLVIRILDNGTARALSWNAIYQAGTDVALPTTTVLSKTMYCAFMYNSAASKWQLLAVTNNI